MPFLSKVVVFSIIMPLDEICKVYEKAEGFLLTREKILCHCDTKERSDSKWYEGGISLKFHCDYDKMQLWRYLLNQFGKLLDMWIRKERTDDRDEFSTVS